MNEPAPIGVAALHPEDLLRIRTSCSHCPVPDHPVASGYRYIDVGGDAPPFYLLRLNARGSVGAITLDAPIELTSGEPAERGAPALARARVSIGVNTIPWSKLLDQDVCSGVWAELMTDALQQLARLDLLDSSTCPICSTDARD
jgi:hypothetical protein